MNKLVHCARNGHYLLCPFVRDCEVDERQMQLQKFTENTTCTFSTHQILKTSAVCRTCTQMSGYKNDKRQVNKIKGGKTISILCAGVVGHACNPNSWEAQTGRSL